MSQTFPLTLTSIPIDEQRDRQIVGRPIPDPPAGQPAAIKQPQGKGDSQIHDHAPSEGPTRSYKIDTCLNDFIQASVLE